MTKEIEKQIEEEQIADASEFKETDNKKETKAQMSEQIRELSNEINSEPTSEAKVHEPKASDSEDEYAEVPEEVLDKEDLKGLEEMKEETAKRVNGNSKEKRRDSRFPSTQEVLSAWNPKTKLGQDVKDGRIKNIDEILDANKKILEPEIVDSLINIQSDLISIGQSKGKFGGGKRRAWRQTQRKTKEGNVPSFSAMAVVGDRGGHIGIGDGKAKETLPARDKAIRKAKLNIFKIKRTCSAFDCDCSELHTILFEVTGKCGSVKVTLIPAPQGTGLVVGGELKKVLALAGIKDVYSRTSGRKRTTFNLIKACIDALKKTNVGGGK